MKRVDWKVLIWSFLAVFGAAGIGSIFTDTGPWYQSVKPSITPPNFVFPIVWTILFFLIFLALYFSYTNAKKEDKKKILRLYGLNLILNVLWTLLYFRLHNPFFAFFEVILLFISIAWIILVSYRIDRKAAYMLLPYILWVSFAAVLTFLSIR